MNLRLLLILAILSFTTFIMVSPSQEDNPQENNHVNNDQFNEDQTNRTSFSGIIIINSTDWSFGNYSIISVYPITGGPLFPTSNVTVISYQTASSHIKQLPII
ncbi:MAG: hypothetical protein ACXAB7_08645 [Candidatus Kariarchaeaceae archaeon]|jgi:hypothetical protein